METLQTSNFPKLPELISRLSQDTGISLDQTARQNLLFYFTELYNWNRVTNLTGIKDPEALVLKHLGDTLLLMGNIPQNTRTVLDIGTGAGIPGLLMKLIRPGLYMVLAEAVKKKCSFLYFIMARLGLSNIFITNRLITPQNPPEFMPENGFDIIVSQAAGSVKWFVETGLDFLAPKGSMFLLKGPSGEQELEDHAGFLNQRGLYPCVQRKLLPLTGHRRLILELKRKPAGDG